MRRPARGGRRLVATTARRGGALALATLFAGCSVTATRSAPATEVAFLLATPIAPVASIAAPVAAPDAGPVAEPVADPAAPASAGLFSLQQGRDAIPPPADTRMSYERGPSEAFNWGHVCFDAEYIPAMWVTADVDSNGVSGTRGDLDTGSGMALRAGFGSVSQNIGVLYMGTWHDEQTTGRGASTQQLLIDFLYRAPIPEMNNLVWLEVDAGLGGVDLEFDSPTLDNEVTGSALLHGDLEFRLGKSLWIALGGGGFIWGHFGDTVAYGTWVDLGVKLIF